MKKRIICLIMAITFIMLTFVSCGTKEAEESGGVNYSGLSFSDIYGNEYNDIFKESKLTVLNLFATWCPPCVRELPELQKLSEAVADKNIAVYGIVTDTLLYGEVQNDIVDTAKQLAENAGVRYPMLIPDESSFKGYIDQMQVFPVTLFIDSDGNIVEEVEGSNDFDGWLAFVERVVSSLEG